MRIRFRSPLWRWLFLCCFAVPAAGVAQSAPVAVASHDLARGVVLVTADIGYVPAVLPRLAPAAHAPVLYEPAIAGDSLIGWTTRRLITMGEPLRAPAVVPPQLVKSGDLVDVVYQAAGVVVTMRGKATKSASIGERLVVRMDNQRKLEGTVVGPNRVRVN